MEFIISARIASLQPKLSGGALNGTLKAFESFSKLSKVVVSFRKF
jgi:hypothetical protein